jgi:hypothetical protein
MGKRERKRHAGSKGSKSKSSRRVRGTARSSSLALENLANAMNHCEREMSVLKCAHGIIFSDAGYVLPIGDKWVVRTLKQL